MAVFKWGLGLDALEAGEDLSNALNTFCKIGTDGKLYQADSGDNVCGVITEADIAGRPVTYQYSDIAKIILAATLNAGDEVMSDDDGKAIAYVDSPAGNVGAGVLREGGVAGDVVSVRLRT